MLQHPTKLLSFTDTNTKYKVKLFVKKPPVIYSGINICMINQNGDALLKQETIKSYEMEHDFIFDGPDIGNISSILLSQDNDKLYLKDVSINIQNDDRYVDYKFNIINDKNISCTYMIPFIAGDNIDMKPVYDAEYKVLKDNILYESFELTVLGTILVSVISSIESGYAFGIGGSIGLLYMKLLQSEIDVIEKKKGPNVSRLALVLCLVVAILTKYKEQIHEDQMLFINGVIGFFMYKIAIIESYLKNRSK